MAVTAFREDLSAERPDETVELAKKAILSRILDIAIKFKPEYGELVFCTDASRSFRKDIFPHYKMKRKENREKSDIPWDLIYQAMNEIIIGLKDCFPYKVIEVEGAEADDCIAILATTGAIHMGKEDILGIEETVPERVLVYSTDKDLKQLLKHKWVRQYSPYHRQYVKLETTAKEFLKRLVLTGDSGDGIPNVFSPLDSFYTKTRQKPCTEKKMAPLLEAANMIDAADTDVATRIVENMKLISFDLIPKRIRDGIMSQFTQEKEIRTKLDIYRYLSLNNHNLLLPNIEDF